MKTIIAFLLTVVAAVADIPLSGTLTNAGNPRPVALSEAIKGSPQIVVDMTALSNAPSWLRSTGQLFHVLSPASDWRLTDGTNNANLVEVISSGADPRIVSSPATLTAASNTFAAAQLRVTNGASSLNILPSGNTIYDLDFINATNSDAARIRLFRHTSTTNTVDFQILKGNGSSQVAITLSGSSNNSYINNGGNFGIGITTPTERLHVLGNILASNIITAWDGFRLSSNSLVTIPVLAEGDNFYFASNGVPHVVWLLGGVLTTNNLATPEFNGQPAHLALTNVTTGASNAYAGSFTGNGEALSNLNAAMLYGTASLSNLNIGTLTLSNQLSDDVIADGITASNYLLLAGGTLTGPLTASSNIVVKSGAKYFGHVGSATNSAGVTVDALTSGVGDVTAASSFGTDNRLIRSDGTGKGVQGSAITVDDGGSMTISSGNGITMGNTSFIIYGARAQIWSEGNGDLTFYDTAQTGFRSLRFGGTGAGATAIVSTNSGIEIKSGNLAFHTNLTAKGFIAAGGTFAGNGAGIYGDLALASNAVVITASGGATATSVDGGRTYNIDVTGGGGSITNFGVTGSGANTATTNGTVVDIFTSGLDPRFTSSAGTITSGSNTFAATTIVGTKLFADEVNATNSSSLVMTAAGQTLNLGSSALTLSGSAGGFIGVGSGLTGITFDQLSDVTITSAAAGHAIGFNGTVWTNGPATGGASLNHVLTSLSTNNAQGTLTNANPTNLFGAGVIPIAKIATGTPDGSKFIRDDGTLQSISGGGDALVANPLSQFAATTSAQLRGVLSDEDGTGVFLTANGAGSSLTAVNAITGDSATAFFSSGTLEDARLSANVSLLGSEIALGTETSGNYAAGDGEAGGATVLRVAAGSGTLSASGQVSVNTTGKLLGIHNGTKEVALPLIQHREFSFDPKAVCDGAVDRLFLFKVGAWAPNGITITGWRVSFEADPTTEVDLDLKRADAFIGVANSAVIDVLDTTAGASSETTAANINSGAVVANGKVVYLDFGTAYTETTHQIIFEIEYEVEED